MSSKKGTIRGNSPPAPQNFHFLYMVPLECMPGSAECILMIEFVLNDDRSFFFSKRALSLLGMRKLLELDARRDLEEYPDQLKASQDAREELMRGWRRSFSSSFDSDYDAEWSGARDSIHSWARGGHHRLDREFNFPHDAELWNRALEVADRVCETKCFEMQAHRPPVICPLVIPDWFFPRFQMLTFLCFYGIGIEEIPQAVGLCLNLQVLQVFECPMLRRISAGLAKCTSLRSLSIRTADLERIPPQLYSGLRRLECIDLSACGKAIPLEYHER